MRRWRRTGGVGGSDSLEAWSQSAAHFGSRETKSCCCCCFGLLVLYVVAPSSFTAQGVEIYLEKKRNVVETQLRE